MKRVIKSIFFAALVSSMALMASLAHAEKKKHKKSLEKTVASAEPEKRKTKSKRARAEAPSKTASAGGKAEAQLIDIYKLVGQAKGREALVKAESLVRDHPNFQLAQLVYGDLLAAQLRPLHKLGDVPDATAKAAGNMLTELRDESVLRLKALTERPAAGMIPSQFLSLSLVNKHAIAIDASKSRLYLFENTATGLRLLGDYYVSLGKSGIEKSVEGDARTPLGIYFVTSNLDPKSLTDFYGSGALPINYPNALDLKRGKTGSGIWLHGTPPTQFSRAPLASDGCLVLANPDIERIISTVEIRTTPVVIAQSLKWVAPQTIKADSKPFEDALQAWHSAKSSGDINRVASWYASDFTSNGKTLTEWTPALRTEMDKLAGRQILLKDVSYLRWTDATDTMVITFVELVQGAKVGRVKRQYWSRSGSQWKIFHEGIIG